MRKNIIIMFLGLISCQVYSQTTFEEGYFIKIDGEKVNCLIKNKDWEKNPSNFKFKTGPGAPTHTLSIDSVAEFAVVGKSKYEKHTVNIDESGTKLDELDNNRNPEYEEKTLFLKVLVDGNANLYSYNGDGKIKYFFKPENSDVVEQLIFKSFLTNKNMILKNNLYRQQLKEKVNCEEIPFSTIQNLEYSKKDLVNYFTTYNQCHDSPYIVYGNDKRDLFNLTLKTGINHSSLDINNDDVYYNGIDIGSKTGFRLGVEAEYILPFNNNKWSVFIEPAYQYFKSSATKVSIVTIGEEITADVDYKSIEMVLGLKYTMYLNNNSRIFINPIFLYDLAFDSNIIIVRDDGLQLEDLTINSQAYNIGLGLGYNFMDRYSLELRYHRRDLLSKRVVWNGAYETINLNFGFRVF